MLNDKDLYNFAISKKFFVGSFVDFILLDDEKMLEFLSLHGHIK